MSWKAFLDSPIVIYRFIYTTFSYINRTLLPLCLLLYINIIYFFFLYFIYYYKNSHLVQKFLYTVFNWFQISDKFVMDIWSRKFLSFLFSSQISFYISAKFVIDILSSKSLCFFLSSYLYIFIFSLIKFFLLIILYK